MKGCHLSLCHCVCKGEVILRKRNRPNYIFRNSLFIIISRLFHWIGPTALGVFMRELQSLDCSMFDKERG